MLLQPSMLPSDQRWPSQMTGDGVKLHMKSGVDVQLPLKRREMLLWANPDDCSPVSKASHAHGNAHMVNKLLWERSAKLSPLTTELLPLQESTQEKQTGSFL